ncbi:hypothetical protein RND71_005073 [Anisodus tanguticus]|uniref:Uncharacterized protein n=1 Tax=Anisodus tanguticus TaxID=243964 RepID=A0AAE1VRZ8_9SOLA|nr:hypothetical protein RND71_005073 [Anisodus tanguticus]
MRGLSPNAKLNINCMYRRFWVALIGADLGEGGGDSAPTRLHRRCFLTGRPDHDTQVLRDVLDTYGNPLNTSSRYLILPAYTVMNQGGARLANLGDKKDDTTCSTSVVLSHHPTVGIAVYFTPKNPKFQKIVVSSPVNIHFFLDYYLCANLTVWKVDNLGKLAPRHTISTGAQLSNPLDMSSWFQIKPLNGKYKLVFCPDTTCHNIGIVRQSGYDRLVLSENPFLFDFQLDDRIGKAIA